jgi:hypothetical protein
VNPPESPARPQPRREISRRWFIIIGAAWVVVLVASAWWGLSRAQPTDREQTTVGQAVPYVNDAIARVADAVTANGTGVVAVSGFERVGSCEVTIFRTGVEYQRVLVAVVPPGTELRALDRVALALSAAAYKPAVSRGEVPRLTADARYWVLLTGTVTGPGEIRFVADTGRCRSLGTLPPEPAMSLPTGDASRLMEGLGLTTASTTEASVPCVGVGRFETVEARSGVYKGDLRQAVPVPDGSAVVVSEPRLFAYRTGDAQVAIRADPDATVVTSTTGCQ